MSSQGILIVGAGLSGSVIARELAESGYTVTVLERRSHVAGNAHDYTDASGIRVHQYGPHLFHTSNMKVVAWLSRFTGWLDYQHRVKAQLEDGRLVTLPVNRETKAIVGEANVLDVFFRPYTQKMWGMSLDELDPEIVNRVPVRDDLNELYFPSDTFQALPTDGYTAMVQRMLDHPRITTVLGQPFAKAMEADYAHVFNAMAIDEYFDFEFGRLPYRSIKFHQFTVPVPHLFPVATVNFTHSEKFTRATEWKRLPGHGANAAFTTITVEEPCDYADNNYERYYPVKDTRGDNLATYRKYRDRSPPHMTFIGRCGMYAYLDMHQAVSTALSVASDFLASRGPRVRV